MVYLILSGWAGGKPAGRREPSVGGRSLSTGSQPAILCSGRHGGAHRTITTVGLSSRWPAGPPAPRPGLVKAAGSSSDVAERGEHANPLAPDTR
jgi:hypothetical protein